MEPCDAACQYRNKIPLSLPWCFFSKLIKSLAAYIIQIPIHRTIRHATLL